jgi:hypothetical protein
MLNPNFLYAIPPANFDAATPPAGPDADGSSKTELFGQAASVVRPAMAFFIGLALAALLMNGVAFYW